MDDGKARMVQLYRKRARRYDFTANLFYLIGFREWAYRKQAVAALHLRPGDTVVEIGCGTGLNFSLLEDAVGPQGRVIGVDLTDAMLDRARQRVRYKGWTNVELVECDAAGFRFPESTDAVLATFAIKAMPDYDAIIRQAAEALPAGRCFVFLELVEPGWCPGWLRWLMIRLLSPFGANEDNAAYRPEAVLKRYFPRVLMKTRYFGVALIAVGIAGEAES